MNGPVPSVGGAKRSFNVSSSEMSTAIFDANSDTPIAASPISPKKAKLCHSINTLTYPTNNKGLLESSVAQDGRPSLSVQKISDGVRRMLMHRHPTLAVRSKSYLLH